MNASPHFAYLQARLQADYARRPDIAVWASLDQAEEFGRYLQQASATGFGRWTERLGLNSDTHAIEISTRDSFRQYVRLVASWMPPTWEAATQWFAWLIDLEVIRRVAAGEDLPDWASTDPLFQRLTEGREKTTGQLLGLDGDGEGVARSWRTEWRRSWPDVDADQRRQLSALSSLLPVQALDDDGQQSLTRSFRRNAGQPMAVFSYLALVLSDLQRLRGGLIRRQSFSSEGA